MQVRDLAQVHLGCLYYLHIDISTTRLNPIQSNRGATQVFPLFILDPHFAKPERIGALRYRFMLQTIACVVIMAYA